MTIDPFNSEPEQEFGKCCTERGHQPVLGQHVDSKDGRVGLAVGILVAKISGTVVKISVSLPPPLNLYRKISVWDGEGEVRRYRR